MCHGPSLDKVGENIGEYTGTDKDTSGKVIDLSRALPGLQAGTTKFWVGRARHSGRFIIDQSCDYNHRQCEQANGYFVLGQHNQKWEYANQAGKTGTSTQSDKKCWQGTAYQC